MASPADWALGYGRQARADFATFQLLREQSAPQCHWLQFLQMACEKLCKAHLCGDNADPRTLQGSHQYIRGPLPVVLRRTYSWKLRDARKGAWALSQFKHLALEIELLSPAVSAAARPENCEYPWENSAGELRVPIDWSFTPTSLLVRSAGRTFLKLMNEALSRFA